jgi:hypothetical protein
MDCRSSCTPLSRTIEFEIAKSNLARGLSECSEFLAFLKLLTDVGPIVNKWIAKGSPAPDPVMQSLQLIHEHLKDIEDTSLAAWAGSREENLAFLLAHASSALRTAAAFRESGKPRSDSEWAAKTALAERDSLLAIETFLGDMQGGFWLRPNSVAAISQAGDPTSFSRGWMPHMPDRAEIHSTNLVWDHRWALPATVYVVTVRIGVLRLLNVNDRLIRREVQRYNTFIAQVFRKMESGIRSLETLSPLQIQRIPTHGVPIAVADIYGGYFLGGQFVPTFQANGEFTGYPLPVGQIRPGLDLETILANARAVTRHWRNHVAITIGLPKLLEYAGQLENIITAPPAPPPEPVAEPGFASVFHSGGSTPPGSGAHKDGVIFAVSPNGELHWYRSNGDGNRDISTSSGWHPNSGNRIGNGWQGFPFLIGGGNGAILAVAANGDLHWFRYDGSGEEDVSGATGWHPNSGNIIGRTSFTSSPPRSPARRLADLYFTAWTHKATCTGMHTKAKASMTPLARLAGTRIRAIVLRTDGPNSSTCKDQEMSSSA